MKQRLFEPVNVYVGLITAAGAVVLVTSALALPATPHPREWATVAVLALVASRFPLRVPGRNAWFGISDTFFFASTLLFGPAPATLTVAIDSMLMSSAFKTWSLRRFMFNMGGPAFAFWAGAQVFFLLSGTGPLFGGDMPVESILLPIACFALVYYGLNSGLLAIALALEKGVSPVTVWRTHFAVLLLNYFASASIAFLVVLLTQYLSIIALVAAIPLLGVINFATRSWAGRIEDAEKHVATVDRLYLSTIGALSTAIEAKDGVTSSHIHRVQHYAMGLAKALGPLDELTLKAIQAAALLHDTGKLAVPERILNKPGKLTPAEFEAMKLHVDVGADILSSIDFPYPVVPIVRAHHENWDGSGYPNGLKGIQIPIGARILSVVDCYDALTSDRPYRTGMTDDQALAIIRARRGTFYDPAVVDMFDQVCRDIGPLPVKPQLQKAIEKISRAVAKAQPEPVVAPAPAPVSEGPESLRALANLARVISGRPTTADVSSLIWSHVRHLVPNASCAFFVSDAATDTVRVAFVAGTAGSMLQGLEMKLGEKLTGWVAEHRQPILNSEARLDLGPEAALAGLHYCASLPMIVEDQLVGVLSLYAAEAFRDDQTETLQLVMPHLAQMLASIDKRADSGTRQALRIISRN
jgi:putative nucleotidyltransferase with HDIG domain